MANERSLQKALQTCHIVNGRAKFGRKTSITFVWLFFLCKCHHSIDRQTAFTFFVLFVSICCLQTFEMDRQKITIARHSEQKFSEQRVCVCVFANHFLFSKVNKCDHGISYTQTYSTDTKRWQRYKMQSLDFLYLLDSKNT